MNKICVQMALTVLFCAGAFAQNAPPSDAGPNALFFQSAVVGPGDGVGGAGVFLSTELPGSEKVITGAPYTATVSTEMTQVLGDGNRIDNKTTASLARDSQGRTRREETMGMVGPWQVNGPKLVFINDPTSQTNYVLDPDKQTATVLKHAGISVAGAGAATAAGAAAGFRVEYLGKGLGGDQQEEPKDVKDEMKTPHQSNAEHDHCAAHDQRADNSPHQNPVLCPWRNTEMREDEHKHKDVVHAQGVLDQVTGEKIEPMVRPFNTPDDGVKGERHQNPDDAASRRSSHA